MFSNDFIDNAFLAGTFIAIAAGLAGYFVVLRNQVFVADAQSHVAFTGALAAVAAGGDAALGLFGATIAGSLVMGALGGRARGRDVAIGVTFAWILGLGALFLTLYTTSRSASNGAAGVTILFGSIFGITTARAFIAAGVGAAVSLATLALARPLVFSSVDPDVAAARGLPVRTLGLAFMVIVGVTVGEAVQAIGALLIFGLLVTPPLTAQLLTARPYAALALSAALSVASMWAGLTLSYVLPRIPPSFLVVAVAFAAYLVVVVAGAIRGRYAQKVSGNARSERIAAT